MHNEAMFLDPDPAPDSQTHEEWRPRSGNHELHIALETSYQRKQLSEEEATFGCYHPAANERGGCYAE